jgi:hypothetical protein
MLAAVVLFALIQFIPLGGAHANPPILNEPKWDKVETRALAQRACFDCHSNETKWPWYTNVQPMSMLIQKDVSDGRAMINFSEWKGESELTPEFIERVLRSGKMPLSRYLMLHPEARLSSAEMEQLIQGLKSTLSQ